MIIKGNQIVEGSISVGKRITEGFTEILLTEDYNIPNISEKFIRFTTELSQVSVTLPDATTLPNGSEFIIFTTSNGITLKNNSGSMLQTLNDGSLYYIYLVSNSTTAGQWVVSVDTSYDIAVGSNEIPNRGVRSYFKIKSTYTGNLA